MTDMVVAEPENRPVNPNFSSGPCAKRPGWLPEIYANAYVGRSHRARPVKARIQYAIDLTRELLHVPDSYRIGIVPASDTGAVEMAMWSLLGHTGVDVLAWESFGLGWVSDIQNQLKLDNVTVHKAGYGELPDLAQVNCDNDVVFTWNGTTSGVCVPNADWIPQDRKGLMICDATSAVFAQDVDLSKLDVVTFSWQKVLGGEAAHGVIILSPRAVERLETYTPDRPMPKIFRLTKSGKLIEGIFEAATINTPSMICVEDAIDAMEWAKSLGGLDALKAKADANLATFEDWVAKTDWIDFLAKDKACRSNTSVCLSIADDAVVKLDNKAQAQFVKTMVAQLDQLGIAYDIGSYRDAPVGLRVWCGATVVNSDIEALLPWLDYAFFKAKSAL